MDSVRTQLWIRSGWGAVRPGGTPPAGWAWAEPCSARLIPVAYSALRGRAAARRARTAARSPAPAAQARFFTMGEALAFRSKMRTPAYVTRSARPFRHARPQKPNSFKIPSVHFLFQTPDGGPDAAAAHRPRLPVARPPGGAPRPPHNPGGGGGGSSPHSPGSDSLGIRRGTRSNRALAALLATSSAADPGAARADADSGHCGAAASESQLWAGTGPDGPWSSPSPAADSDTGSSSLRQGLVSGGLAPAGAAAGSAAPGPAWAQPQVVRRGGAAGPGAGKGGGTGGDGSGESVVGVLQRGGSPARGASSWAAVSQRPGRAGPDGAAAAAGRAALSPLPPVLPAP
jgi:hypothetical protein